MRNTVDAVERAVEETYRWLGQIAERLETEDRKLAWNALRASLQALRDRIDPGDAVHLAAQLPTLVRGLYYEGWLPAETPRRERHVEDFLDQVAHRVTGGLSCGPEAAARAVFEVLSLHVDEALAAKLAGLLPEPLRGLWPGRVVQRAARHAHAAARH